MMMQPALAARNIRRSYGPVVAVDDVSLEVAQGEFVTLLGPSGSGKTTTLRLIGGFEEVQSGSIHINGRRVDGLPPYRRDTATIFQSGALFPHKTVAGNVAFGLRRRGVPKAEVTARVREILDIVRLSGMEERLPAQLSGGQRQRVALARSLVVRPAVLLFDEPLSALDLALRLTLRAEIGRLHDEMGFSAVFVTHDQGEAMAMSSRVAVMNRGRIVQIDRPEAVYNRPANEFVYTFMGESCCMAVRIAAGAIADSDGAALPLHLNRPPGDGNWRLYVRPGRLRLLSAGEAAPNWLEGRLRFVEFLGDHHRCHLRAGALELFVDRLDCPPEEGGATLRIGWADEDMRAFAL